jgi:Fe-coproporphyrin III synthase
MLHLLGRCNLECQHCYMEGSPRRRDRLPNDLVHSAIAEARELNLGTIVLTGGEPLLYRGLDEVLQHASAQNGIKVTLCTNGTLLTPKRAARLSRHRINLSISVDGEPSFHDRFRHSDGAFRATERGIRAAIDEGLDVTVISSFSQDNIESLEYLFDWAAGIGASQFLAQPLLDLGRGSNIASRCLSILQLNQLILSLSDLANRQGSGQMTCQVVGAKKKFLLEHPCGAFVCNGASCHRGLDREIKKLVVREDGTVLPEVPTLDRSYAIGKLGEAPLAELIERYFGSGYLRFDQLCRSAYAEVLPSWECVIVPWEQILTERSQSWTPTGSAPETGCSTCSKTQYGHRRERTAGGPPAGVKAEGRGQAVTLRTGEAPGASEASLTVA